MALSVGMVTATGVVCMAVSPLPSCPWLPRPHAQALLVLSSASENPCPALMAALASSAVTVTVAEALAFGRAVLVAVIVHVPTVSGAVYVTGLPVVGRVPQPAGETDHVTDVSLVPVTVAVNAADSPGVKRVSLGEIATLTVPSSPLLLVPHDTRTVEIPSSSSAHCSHRPDITAPLSCRSRRAAHMESISIEA